MEKSMLALQSRLDKSFDKYEADLIRKVQFQPTTAWNEAERSATAKAKRMNLALSNFWEFDKIYFPPEAHRQGHFKPGRIHRKMLSLMNIAGIHWILAHRDLAKSAYAIKMYLWLMFKGDMNLLGVYTETLIKSRIVMDTFSYVIKDNPRIFEDFEIEIDTKSENMLTFKASSNPRFCIIMPFSPKKSPRGNTVSMDRLDGLLVDDIETLSSSFDADLVDERIGKLIEAFKSLKKDGVCICLGNNLHPKCAANLLLKEQIKGIKRDYITVYPFPDWSNKITEFVKYKGSVWTQAFPAKSEAEMRNMRKIIDDEEWSQAQCDPKKKGGVIFPQSFYNTYKMKDLPTDARGVAYCDQNLSLRGKGDSSVFGALLYSPKENKLFAYKLSCKSYSDPNELLTDFFGLLDNRIALFAMDGNVAQESSWTANIRNWCMIKGRPYPPLEFKRYSADANVGMAQMPYTQGLVHFEEKFRDTEQGEKFFEQFFGFSGKKAGKKDDAPDWFICCYTFLLERGLVTPKVKGVNNYGVTIIKSKFNF